MHETNEMDPDQPTDDRGRSASQPSDGTSSMSSDSPPAGWHDLVLPEQTSDDTDAGWGEAQEGNDDRLRRDRPPHWD